ncbi:MAG: hypothetical protein CMJ46_11910 [Planctomyces sp.]|nr:hypothetical protein [Planctomyces sp.]
MVASSAYGIAQEADSDAKETNAKETKKSSSTFSPYHSLLGLDPETGTYLPESERTKPKNRQPAARAQKEASTDAVQDVGTASTPGGGNVSTSDTLTDDALRENEQLRNAAIEAMEKLQNGDSSAVDELASLIGGTSGREMLHLYEQLMWIVGGVFLIYPICIIISELISYYWLLRRQETSVSDRRYARGRLWRRLALALVIGGFVVVVTLSSVKLEWWANFSLMAVLMAVMTVLGAAWATLAAGIKQLERGHTITVMREVRRDQLELRKDLQELRMLLEKMSTPQLVESDS